MSYFDPPEVAPVVRAEQSVPDREFTEMELRGYNGERGRPAYIACQGIVYDVTNAPNWRGGMHRDLHYSGLDLTRSLHKAPHSESVFQRVPPVGRLVDDGR